jgi:hypothetical protein
MPAPDYLAALGLTLSLEAPIYAAELKGQFDRRLSSTGFAGVAVNFVSHPLAFLVIAPALVVALGAGGTLVTVELFAWVSETLLLWLWLRRSPGVLGLISLLANSLSLLVGLALFR